MPRFLVCTGSNILLPDSDTLQPATIIVDELTGKITDIYHAQIPRNELDLHGDITWVDAQDKVVLPGLVDTHVHLNEPGRTEWEGFFTGTLAAASGGVTTVVEMPLNSIPPTTTVENLETKRTAAQGQCFTDVAFWGGIIPDNQHHLKPLIRAGVKGFKCFLIDSGIDEFPCVSEAQVIAAMEEIQNGDVPMLFHAELDTHQHKDNTDGDPTQYSTFLDSRPQQLEFDAISLITTVQRSYPNLRCHIVHLSAASALPVIRAAKDTGLKLTVETCFHYLCLSSEEIPSGRPEFKCCPPIRDRGNQDALWDALKAGVIDCVVSDHSPCVAELKHLEGGDIMKAWGGISTLGLGLSLLWTEGKERGITIAQISKWTSQNTARHAGLDAFKGKLEVGYDGDFVIWDPDSSFKVTAEDLGFRNKVSAYVGRTVRGRVEQTYLRGRMIYNRISANAGPVGQLI
ncbi:hypothetical protein M378DRAFT_161075 [Amanita muscaria Koide BX008]|uniref:allantoinase n=1 Tax=Amanita muscaria (strain Koide BX008) TaxID=946122 RepID=A0A0C2XA68_AMAMK|nr:hypothetical protein M378DRAFT_161075 [Amanita muscaria Koide BX008]